MKHLSSVSIKPAAAQEVQFAGKHALHFRAPHSKLSEIPLVFILAISHRIFAMTEVPRHLRFGCRCPIYTRHVNFSEVCGAFKPKLQNGLTILKPLKFPPRSNK